MNAHAQLYGTLAQVVFWSVLLPLIVGHFFTSREPALFVGLLWGFLAEALLAIFLGYYMLSLGLVLVFAMQFVHFIVRYDEYQDSYQHYYGAPKQHLPSWVRNTPNALIELENVVSITNVPTSGAPISGELIAAPRPGDRPKGYHRPEAVAHRTGEIKQIG